MNVRDVLPRDAIPSVDDPTFAPVAESPLPPDERVVVYEPGEGEDPPRAYPVRYLDFHEVVNDTVDRPVAVTWCPLCGAAVVYDRRVEGRTLTFGVSGTLADDDLVLYDRETESEWKQSAGKAIDGPLSGSELDVLPGSMSTVGRFRDAHPEGLVLEAPGGESEAASDDDTPVPIEYDAAPYADYAEREGFGLDAHRGTGGRTWERDDIGPKDPVLGLSVDGASLAFPRERVLAAGGVVAATVGGRSVVVFATSDGTHAYADPGYEWTPLSGDRKRFSSDSAHEWDARADGISWDGTSGRSEDGRRLERLPARRLFAFTWQDDNGGDAFWSS